MKKILIVEDEKAYLGLLHDQLAKNGYDVMDAKDGEEGLKLALDNKPDLILLDLIMPKVGGIQMLKALRADTWGKDASVFILTNVNGSRELTEGMSNSVGLYIIKSDMKLDDLLWDIKVTLK